MRKTLTTLAVTAAAFAVPMLSSGTAYAADTDLSADTSAVQELIAAGGGCTTTYVNAVLATPIGRLYSVVIPGGPTVTVFGGAAVTYAGAQGTNTTNYVWCVA
jgi:hypothetical protein